MVGDTLTSDDVLELLARLEQDDEVQNVFTTLG
jgi:transcriptional/translational regulatory protein YebC/TACO1